MLRNMSRTPPAITPAAPGFPAQTSTPEESAERHLCQIEFILDDVVESARAAVIPAGRAAVVLAVEEIRDRITHTRALLACLARPEAA
jgi:tRNA1(Val) A37 N6-methylase TrmN6